MIIEIKYHPLEGQIVNARLRYLFLGLLILLGTVALIGCTSGKKDKGKIKLRFAYWASVSDKHLIDESVERFEQENPDITIVKELSPWEAYAQKMMVQFGGGNPPDVIMTSTEQVSTYVNSNALLDLNPFIAQEKDFSIADYYPELVQRMSKDGKLYVLPRDIDITNCVYYNKKILDDEGLPYPKDDWTWQDLVDMCKKVTKDFDNDGVPDRWGVSFYGFYNAIIYSNGGSLVDNVMNPTRCTIDEPRSLEAMQFWHDLIFKYRVSPTPETISSGLGMTEPDLFKAGRLVFFLAGIWMTPEFQKITDFDWDVAMFPRGPAGDRKFVAEGSGYSITRQCQHPQEAWRFVKFLGGEPGQTILSKPALTQPAIMKLANSPLFLTPDRPKNKRIVVEGAKDGVYRPFTPRWSEVEQNYLNPQINLIMSPDEKVRIPLEKGLRDVTARINRDIFGIK